MLSETDLGNQCIAESTSKVECRTDPIQQFLQGIIAMNWEYFQMFLFNV